MNSKKFIIQRTICSCSAPYTLFFHLFSVKKELREIEYISYIKIRICCTCTRYSFFYMVVLIIMETNCQLQIYRGNWKKIQPIQLNHILTLCVSAKLLYSLLFRKYTILLLLLLWCSTVRENCWQKLLDFVKHENLIDSHHNFMFSYVRHPGVNKYCMLYYYMYISHRWWIVWWRICVMYIYVCVFFDMALWCGLANRAITIASMMAKTCVAVIVHYTN